VPTTATTIHRVELTLPAAQPGPPGPLPPLRPLDEMHELDARDLARFPRDMARQLRYEPLHSLLPVQVIDGYHRARTRTALPAVVLENDKLRVTVLPGLGGRVHSLVHKPTGRELLYRNPVLQPADFALNGAWFSGGIEWNIGATGHTTLSVAPLHAARVPAPDGAGDMLRLWEWERLRDLPFQVDLWLPEGSEFLYVGVRIRNPHVHPAPTYWWSNIAVPEEHRVLAPADEAWHFGYQRSLRRVPVPELDGTDRSYPLHSVHPADFFYEVPDGQRRWITALDDQGHGLVQTSTDLLRGRKLFVWGAGPGGRRWQQWLTEPGTGGYAEIQAGLVRTQLEHVRMEPESELTWLEAYGPLSAAPSVVHGTDWTAARAEAEDRLAAALPRAEVDAAYEAWRACADSEPGERLATGSGWGALEVLRGRYKLPGTPFDEATLGADQQPWRQLLESGAFPAGHPDGEAFAAAPAAPPSGAVLVSPHWRDMLETAPATALTEYHLGIAQWHAGDRAQAVRSWERGLQTAVRPPDPRPAFGRWPLLRCLAVADAESAHPERAADRYDEAFDDLCAQRPGAFGDDGAPAGDGTPEWIAVTAALGREAIAALLAAGRVERARAVWQRLDGDTRGRGRFRLIEAELLIAEGRPDAARAVFDDGFEVADLREGDEVLGEVWGRITGEPLPDAYDFRMRPPEA
jgi:tetratricopeptide (TPR) repeat protein